MSYQNPDKSEKSSLLTHRNNINGFSEPPPSYDNFSNHQSSDNDAVIFHNTFPKEAGIPITSQISIFFSFVFLFAVFLAICGVHFAVGFVISLFVSFFLWFLAAKMGWLVIKHGTQEVTITKKKIMLALNTSFCGVSFKMHQSFDLHKLQCVQDFHTPSFIPHLGINMWMVRFYFGNVHPSYFPPSFDPASDSKISTTGALRHATQSLNQLISGGGQLTALASVLGPFTAVFKLIKDILSLFVNILRAVSGEGNPFDFSSNHFSTAQRYLEIDAATEANAEILHDIVKIVSKHLPQSLDIPRDISQEGTQSIANISNGIRFGLKLDIPVGQLTRVCSLPNELIISALPLPRAHWRFIDILLTIATFGIWYFVVKFKLNSRSVLVVTSRRIVILTCSSDKSKSRFALFSLRLPKPPSHGRSTSWPILTTFRTYDNIFGFRFLGLCQGRRQALFGIYTSIGGFLIRWKSIEHSFDIFSENLLSIFDFLQNGKSFSLQNISSTPSATKVQYSGHNLLPSLDGSQTLAIIGKQSEAGFLWYIQALLTCCIFRPQEKHFVSIKKRSLRFFGYYSYICGLIDDEYELHLNLPSIIGYKQFFNHPPCGMNFCGICKIRANNHFNVNSQVFGFGYKLQNSLGSSEEFSMTMNQVISSVSLASDVPDPEFSNRHISIAPHPMLVATQPQSHHDSSFVPTEIAEDPTLLEHSASAPIDEDSDGDESGTGSGSGDLTLV